MKFPPNLIVCLFLLIIVSSSNGQLLNAIQKKRVYDNKEKSLIRSFKKRAHFNVDGKRYKKQRVSKAQVKGVVVDTSEFYKYMQVKILDKYGYVHNYDNCSETKQDFTFSGLYPGTYTLKFDNYYYDYPEYLGGDTSISNATWFSLSEGEVKDLDSIKLSQIDLNTETSKDTFVVSGFVYKDSTNNKPFDGNMMLTLMRAPKSGNASSATSQSPFIKPDSTGYFSLKVPLLPGEYYGLLKNIDKDTTFYSPFWITGEKLYEEPTKITVPGSLNNLSLHLTLGARITGTVFDENGDTITGSIDLVLIDSNGYTISTTYCNSDFPKYSFTAIKPGEYYLKTDYPYDYVEHWYYPGTTDITKAEKIKVLPGQVSNYNFTLKSAIEETSGDSGVVLGTALNHNGDTLNEVEFEIKYEDGNADWMWSNGGGYSFAVKSGSNFKFCASVNDWRTPEIYSTPTWYTTDASISNASSLVLSKDEEKIANITMLPGGSIAGYTQNNGEYIAISQEFEDTVNGAWEYESEYVFIVKNIEDTSIVYYRDIDITDVMGGFRLSGIYPGKYVITAFPYSEYYESVDYDVTTSIQPVGYNNIVSDTITVTEFNTAEVIINTNDPVSGMIKGSYTFDNKTEYDDDYLVYIFNSDKKLMTLTWCEWEYDCNKSLKTPNDVFKTFFPVDDNAWIQLHDTIGLSGVIESPILTAQLGAGDYYMAVVYWKEVGKNEEAFIHWYGQDSAMLLLSSYFDELDITNIGSLPNDAKKITLDTDSSIVDGITFGATPIFSKILNLKDSFISKPFLSQGILKFHYNISYENMEQAEIKLYTLQGRNVYSRKIKDRKGICNINLNDNQIISGMYVLKLDIGSKSLKYPIIYVK